MVVIVGRFPVRVGRIVGPVRVVIGRVVGLVVMVVAAMAVTVLGVRVIVAGLATPAACTLVVGGTDEALFELAR